MVFRQQLESCKCIPQLCKQGVKGQGDLVIDSVQTRGIRRRFTEFLALVLELVLMQRNVVDTS